MHSAMVWFRSVRGERGFLSVSGLNLGLFSKYGSDLPGRYFGDNPPPAAERTDTLCVCIGVPLLQPKGGSPQFVPKTVEKWLHPIGGHLYTAPKPNVWIAQYIWSQEKNLHLRPTAVDIYWTLPLIVAAALAV